MIIEAHEEIFYEGRYLIRVLDTEFKTCQEMVDGKVEKKLHRVIKDDRVLIIQCYCETIDWIYEYLKVHEGILDSSYREMIITSIEKIGDV